MNKKRKGYVCYFRVSTKAQGESGAGIDGQKSTVSAFLKKTGGECVKDFIEFESGGKSNRPELLKALAYCKQQKLKLCVASLDRLSRDLFFIVSLERSKIDFVCVDYPSMDRLQLHIMASLAEWERGMISKRTKAALAERRKAGVALGFNNPKVKAGLLKYWQAHKTPKPDKSLARAKAKTRAHKPAQSSKRAQADTKVFPMIKTFRARGLSFAEIADALNENGLRTRRGRLWNKNQCCLVAKRNGLSARNRKRQAGRG